MNSIADAHSNFTRVLEGATTPELVYEALYELTNSIVGVRLFIVMTVDMDAGLARRAFTSDPENYPNSGTKPIVMNSWFEIVHGRRESFVANTLEEIAGVFPDYALIGSLGCASVMNLPIFDGGSLLATINLLDEADYFTQQRVELVHDELAEPARTAVMAAGRQTV